MEVVGAASWLVVTDAVPRTGSSVAEPRDAPPVIEKETLPEVTGTGEDPVVVRVAFSIVGLPPVMGVGVADRTV